MEKHAAQRIMDMQEALREVPDYQTLIAEHGRLNARFLETVSALTESQRAVIFDYLGLLVEMHTKQLEWACR